MSISAISSISLLGEPSQLTSKQTASQITNTETFTSGNLSTAATLTLSSAATVLSTQSSTKSASTTSSSTPSAVSSTSSTSAASSSSPAKLASSGSTSSSSGAKGGSGSASASSSSSEASDLVAAVYTTTVDGKSYTGDVSESDGEYTVSVQNVNGATASGSSIQAAENNLTTVIDELV